MPYTCSPYDYEALNSELQKVRAQLLSLAESLTLTPLSPAAQDAFDLQVKMLEQREYDLAGLTNLAWKWHWADTLRRANPAATSQPPFSSNSLPNAHDHATP